MLSSSLRWKKKSRFSAKQAIILLALIIVSIFPIAFQKRAEVTEKKSHRTLTIITSHNEATRREFGAAFAKWWKDKTHGEIIYINWITATDQKETGRIIDKKFADFEKRSDKESEQEDGNNVGIDVYFGGGVHEFARAKAQDYLTTLTVFKENKEFFYTAAETDDNDPSLPEEAKGASIPQTYRGETFYDADRKWIGACISSYGIVFNKDSLKRLGLTEDKFPTKWEHLADPIYFKNIALADPSKSDSITKIFELIIQEKMQKHIKENPTPLPAETPERHRQRILNEGWEKGLRLVQKICANARYFTDNASNIPHDVANGDAAVGVCIDYYGRTYNSKHKQEDNISRIEFRTPIGGSSLTADPIAVFKHAAQPDLAQKFVEFVMSDKGQLLWNGDPKFAKEMYYVPRESALRRLPIRKEIYLEPYIHKFTDSDVLPYSNKHTLFYDEKLTGKAFDALQTIIRVMAIDTHDELSQAWMAIAQLSEKVRSLQKDKDSSKHIELRQRYLEILDQHFHGISKVSYTKTISDFTQKINKMKRKHQLSTQLKILEDYNFSPERMALFYPNLKSEEYPQAIKALKSEVEQLKSFDIMTLELQQQDLASQFRASYKKAIRNADNL